MAGLAGLGLFLVLAAPSIAKADNCGSLLSSINQLKAQIPREPRDAAADDRQVLDNYVGLYNRACTGGGSSPGGGYGGVPRGNNNLSNGLGAAADALNALSDLADELDREQQEEDAARQRQEEQEEMDAALEQAREEAAQRAAEAQERAAEAAARSADDTQRQAMANPFAGSSASGGGAANPFAGKSQNANPFATTASAGSNPKATAPAKSGAAASSRASSRAPTPTGFKSDAQIAAECAKSGNPNVCRATEIAARAQSPAYQKYAAEQKQTIQKNVDDAQKKVDQAFKDFDNQKAKRSPSDQLGALPKILAGIPPDNDEGDECGPLGYGRRHGGQCMFPWTQSPEACADVNGSYYPADDDHPTAFCGTGAPANPMTAYPGPNEGAQCGDVAGHIHGGACWALGITHDDCDALHGVIMDNGGLQYCAYNADEVAKEQAAAADVLRRQKYLDDLRKKLAGGDDVGTPGGGGPTTTDPIVPITTTPTDTTPPPEKQAWTPDYECRLADGTVFHTSDPRTIGGEDPNSNVGFDPLHKWDCHLTNMPASFVGLTADPSIKEAPSDVK